MAERVKVFTEEWVRLLDVQVQTTLAGFDWKGEPPSQSLDITYRILFEDDLEKDKDAEFVYHIQCHPDGFRVKMGEADSTKNTVTFSQTAAVARGIISGELDSHIEFLMGRIQIEGDVLALQDYREILKKLSEATSTLSNY